MTNEIRQLITTHFQVKSNRVVSHCFGLSVHKVAIPITFTPFASTEPCSARCLFCSETLQTKNQTTLSASLRPDERYFDRLRQLLTHLYGLPLGISLSGLEATDNPIWLIDVCEVLSQAEREGLVVDDKVLYTNGNGFLSAESGLLRQRLCEFGLNRIELSRHHPDQTLNQRIMRFKAKHIIQQQSYFELVVKQLIAEQSVKLVCIVQKGGIATVEGIISYLNWAYQLGVREVVFRELSKMGPLYKPNQTYQTIESSRVDISGLLTELIRREELPVKPLHLTEGYYYWNAVLMWHDLIKVTFEVADYEQMHRKHSQDVIYKLVYHANGNLCASWNPNEHVVIDSNCW